MKKNVKVALKNVAQGVILGFILAGLNAICVNCSFGVLLLLFVGYAFTIILEIQQQWEDEWENKTNIIVMFAMGLVIVLLALVLNKIGILPKTLLGQPLHIRILPVGFYLPLVVAWYGVFGFLIWKTLADICQILVPKPESKFRYMFLTMLITVILIVWATL